MGSAAVGLSLLLAGAVWLLALAERLGLAVPHCGRRVPARYIIAMNARPADSLKIALAQLNPTVGDVAGNADKVRRARDQAAAQGADLVVFPELFIAGYPPEDLVLKPAFQAACRAAVEALARETATAARRCSSARPGSRTASSTTPIALLDGRRDRGAALQGRPAELRRVRREARVRAGPDAGAGRCSRACASACRSARTSGAPRWSNASAETGGEILLVPNGSPYWRGKTDAAAQHRGRARGRDRPAAGLCQPVGGQDELVFDGALVRAQRRPQRSARSLPTFREAVALTQWRREAGGWRCVDGPMAHGSTRATRPTTRACVLGLRDYVDKNGFHGVVLGLSGGIDSALCAAMAVDALGAERVRCVMLPSRYTSQDSLDDAAAVRQGARRPLRHRADRAARCEGFEQALTPLFAGTPARRHRGEHPGARARRDPDGDLQQVRADGGDDRQQVGDVGRLRHALRRHERRLQSDQGPLQDRGVPAVAAAQRVEAARARSGPTAR